MVRGASPVLPDAYTFSFGAQDERMYEAKPSLTYEKGLWVLRAQAVSARYLLSIDILHSLYR